MNVLAYVDVASFIMQGTDAKLLRIQFNGQGVPLDLPVV